MFDEVVRSHHKSPKKMTLEFKKARESKRKARTTMTHEKLELLNKIFKEISEARK